MARKLIVEVAADISAYLRGLEKAEHATHAVDVQVKELNVDTRKLAETQVAAAVRSTQRLERQAAAYRQLAASAAKGSHEQVAAVRLAERAEARLTHQTGQLSRESAHARGEARALSRELGHAARGAAEGSGLFHTFGRSLAFASGGFIAFHEAGEFIRESINAAREAVVSQRSLAAQMRASGESFTQHREQIEKVALSYGKFGFQNDEVIASLTVLERGTGNINKAIGLQGVTADLARAKNLRLAQAANILAKVFGGQETALRRAVPGLAKNAHGMDLIRLAQAKLAGQAAANTTAADKFQATLHDTEEIVGQALLPTLDKYLGALGKWLQHMNETGELQKRVKQTTELLTEAFNLLKGALDALNRITGSTGNSLKLLLGTMLALKGLKLGASLIDSFAKIGGAATEATGKARVLKGALLSMRGLAITVGIELVLHPPKQFQKYSGQAQGGGWEGFKKAWLNFLTDASKPGMFLATGQWPSTKVKVPAPPMEITPTLALQGPLAPKAPSWLPRLALHTEQVRNKIAQAADPFAKLPKLKPPTVQQRNVWFDAMIDRQLDRVQDAPLEGQLRMLDKIADTIRKRAAKTDDITRLLHYEDRVRGILRQEAQVRAQLAERRNMWFDTALDRQLDIITDKSLKQQVVSYQKVADNLRRQIALVHDITRQQTLGDKLRGVLRDKRAAQAQLDANAEEALQKRQDRLAKAREKRLGRIAARQFRALGLGPTGEELVPGVTALRRQADQVRDAIAGSFLDTRKTRGMLGQIENVLSGHLGRLGKDVRAKIKEILDGIRQDLKSQEGYATRYAPASTQAIMAALGFNLTPAQRRQMHAVLAQLGPHGLVAPARSQAFATAGGGGVAIHGDVHIHGVQDLKGFEDHLTKRHGARPHLRRGAR